MIFFVCLSNIHKNSYFSQDFIKRTRRVEFEMMYYWFRLHVTRTMFAGT